MENKAKNGNKYCLKHGYKLQKYELTKKDGINSTIRHLLNYHRGTDFTGQQKIVEIYLSKKKYILKQCFMLLKQ